MGRYDFRPSRVHETASRLLATTKIDSKPPWFDVVGNNPPSQILVRTQPARHTNTRLSRHKRKPSKQFRPQKISYREDNLRKNFFLDHPWELARPRVVLEDDGKDYQKTYEKPLLESHRCITGESVVRRQSSIYRELLDNLPAQTSSHLGTDQRKIYWDQAYDQARKEFYQHRLHQDIERRIVQEEATSTGAYFGKSIIQIGSELENSSYNSWLAWADDSYTELEQKRAGGFASSDPNVSGQLELEDARPANDDMMSGDATIPPSQDSSS